MTPLNPIIPAAMADAFSSKSAAAAPEGNTLKHHQGEPALGRSGLSAPVL